MVTALSFMHIRSTVGLARQVKRLARHLISELGSLEKLNEMISQDISAGAVAKTTKAEKTKIALYKRIMGQLEKMTHNEQIEIMEEEKKMQTDERLVADIDRTLEGLPTVKRVLDKILADLKKVEGQISVDSRRIRKEQRDMVRDRERFLRYWTFQSVMGESGEVRLAKVIKRLAKKESAILKKEEKGQSVFFNNLQKLAKAVKERKTAAAEKLATKLEGSNIIDLFGKEIKVITEMLHDVNIIMIHMVSKVQKDLPKELGRLHALGFPEEPMHELSTEVANIQQQIHHQLWQLYRMAKYEAKVAKRAA